MGPEHRAKIANSQVLKRLVEFSEGKEGVEMQPHQVTAALGLLRKVMPDLTENMLKGDEDAPLAFKAVSLAPLMPDDAKD